MGRDPNELAQRVRRRRDDLGISALAVSKAAGLSMNYVRNIERRVRAPRPEALDALCTALKVSEQDRAQWRRLAGIDPDPAATPAARAGRREAWPLLLYAVANHILLARLKLPRLLARKGPTANLIRLALDATDVICLYKQLECAGRLRRSFASSSSTSGRLTLR